MRKKPKTVYVPWLPTPTTPISRGTDPERQFLHHVQQITIQDLAFTSSRLDFWNRLVLAPAQTSEAVRHALVALGAAHWLFLSRTPSGSPTQPETTSLENLILQQYNLAIQDLTARMGESGTTDLHLTLACCLIFFSLESMMGRYAESLQHLRAGSRLLASPNGGGSRESTPSSFESDDAICEMAQTFSTLGLNASMFLDEPIVDDLTLYTRQTRIAPSADDTFATLADARRQMSSIEVELNIGLESSNADNMRHTYHRWHDWASRLDRSHAKLTAAITTQAETHEYLALRLSRHLWFIAISQQPDAVADEAFVEVLDLADTLVQGRRDNHPVFTIQAEVVPALNFICDTTDRQYIQRRAIDLLKGMRRREGMWDSQELAEHLEDSLAARKMLRQGWDDGELGFCYPGEI